MFKAILKAASNALKKLHAKGNYEPKDLLEIPEFKALHDNTNALFSSTIQFEVSNTLKAYLEKDAFVFSGLRTHAQLADARSYLKDEKGNVRSYNDFEQKVLKLNAQYNQNYLQAEYNFAIQSGLSAEKWETFSDDDKRYYLQYRTAKDGKVRDSHAALDETTLPKSDPFWSSYMPPNGWNCRCTTVEVLASDYTKDDSAEAIARGEKATTQIGKNGKNKAEMFRFNPGAEKKIFPPKNAYTPKHCKGGKVDMSGLIGVASIVLSLEDEKCETKKMLEKEAKIRQVIIERNKLKEWAKKEIPADKGIEIITKVPFLEKSYLFRAAIGKIATAGHKNPSEKFIIVRNIKNELKNAKYIGWAEDRIINGVKKHPDVDYWKYYLIEKNNIEHYVCVKKTYNSINKIYSIEDKNGFADIIGIKKENPIR